eukprot:SAG11_NODE_221_length_12151_cov_5.633173_8_plen_164_part_00
MSARWLAHSCKAIVVLLVVRRARVDAGATDWGEWESYLSDSSDAEDLSSLSIDEYNHGLCQDMHVASPCHSVPDDPVTEPIFCDEDVGWPDMKTESLIGYASVKGANVLPSQRTDAVKMKLPRNALKPSRIKKANFGGTAAHKKNGITRKMRAYPASARVHPR